MRAIRAIVIHTSATRSNMFVDAAMIDIWHRNAKPKPYKKIGYHYVIKRNGALEAGRKESEVGAHVGGHNSDTIGICLVGGLNAQTGAAENNYTPEQWNTLRKVLNDLSKRYPQAVVTGHREYSPDLDGDGVVERHEWFKECPCFDAPMWARGNGYRGARYSGKKGYQLL